MRMNMDGSQVETIIKGLQWPHALTVDYERKLVQVCGISLQRCYPGKGNYFYNHCGLTEYMQDILRTFLDIEIFPQLQLWLHL